MARAQPPRIHAQDRLQRSRQRLAQEAARLIAEHGINDYQRARTKAARRLGILDPQAQPRPQDIEQALRAHQRLFHADRQPQHLQQRRESALEAMRFLAEFQPRLFGEVLAGTADAHSVVRLQVFHELPEAVSLFLQEQGIPVDWQDRRLRLLNDQFGEFPLLRFSAGAIPFELVVLPLAALRQPQLAAADGQPLPRASLAQFERQLAAEAASPESPRRQG